ncbi:MAG: hypothetical protein LBC68_13320 [Prevotellaceae bacterium]|jgi:hypothetical protein|nr:hypothetical protein [Prevotellaceae bacterium]
MKKTFYIKTDNRDLELKTGSIVLTAEVANAICNRCEISETVNEEFPLYIAIYDNKKDNECNIDLTAKDAAKLRDFITDLLKEIEYEK